MRANINLHKSEQVVSKSKKGGNATEEETAMDNAEREDDEDNDGDQNRERECTRSLTRTKTIIEATKRSKSMSPHTIERCFVTAPQPFTFS